MSLEAARNFVEMIHDDEALRRTLEDRLKISEEDPEQLRRRLAEVVPVVGEKRGYDFTAEEGFEALEDFREALADGELSDEDLQRVAGGKGSSEGNLSFEEMTGP